MIKIEKELSKKPFMIKNKGQFYIRIANSSRPAPRSVVLNLFSNSVEIRKNIQKLRSSALLLREEFSQTLNFAKAIHPLNVTKAVPIDTSFMRDAILSNESFLREKGFMDNYSQDIIKMLHILEKFNTQIEGFNHSENPAEKRDLQRQFEDASSTLQLEISTVIPMLDKVIKTCDEELKKYD